MNANKEKCNVLKKIRKQLADKLDINLHQEECTYENTCSGTCPKCEQEEKILNQELSKKKKDKKLKKISISWGLTPNICISIGGVIQPPTYYDPYSENFGHNENIEEEEKEEEKEIEKKQ